jgi:hypothetical protein
VRDGEKKSVRGCTEERHLSTGGMKRNTREIRKPKRAIGPDLT